MALSRLRTFKGLCFEDGSINNKRMQSLYKKCTLKRLAEEKRLISMNDNTNQYKRDEYFAADTLAKGKFARYTIR